jgi:predicted phosphodiesterase
MKTVILGDTHGLNLWKQIIELHKDAQRVIFMGDYFDSFYISGVEQLHNFKEIIQFKESTDKEVVMLIGNHDHHYLDVGETYSGFKAAHKWDFNDALKKNMHHLQIAYKLDDILFTHAGVSPVWMNDTFYRQARQSWSKNTIVEDLNELYKVKPTLFNFSHLGWDPSGDSVEQGPLWIRPRSLMKSNKGDDGLKKRFRQVVGHTQVNSIFDSFTASEKAMGERYYLVDAMQRGGYVIYEDGKLTPVEL